MKPARSLLAAFAALTVLCVSAPAETRENRPLKCKTSKARSAKSQGGPALVANVPKSMTPIDLNAVMMTEKKLAKQMVVEGLFAQRTETDALLVTARLINCTNSPIAVQARSSFMDANQIPTEPTSMWRTVFIPARATGMYQERSIKTDQVAAYLIELRREQ